MLRCSLTSQVNIFYLIKNINLQMYEKKMDLGVWSGDFFI